MNTNVHGVKTTAGNTENGGGRRGSLWKRPAWITALILLTPLLGNHFVDGWNWPLGAFILAGTLLFGTGLTFELVTRKADTIAYRVAVGVALAAAFLLVWINLAVGIIGEPDELANGMYMGVLAVGIIGAIIARFQPYGMARALFATALAQMLVAVIVLLAGFGSTGPTRPLDASILTGFFAAPWLLSAWLFRKAARRWPEAGAV